LAGYIEDRWIKKKKDPVTGKRERTARYGKGSRYRIAGIPGVRDKSFDTLEDAKAWLRRAGTDSERARGSIPSGRLGGRVVSRGSPSLP
jgi:hypothetical protein